MLKKDLSNAAKHGFIDYDEFKAQQIEWAAPFQAFSKIKGLLVTFDLFTEIADQTWPIFMFASFPKPDELTKHYDKFIAFKLWFLAMMEANKKDGVLLSEKVEDTDDTFQVNCTWCAWYEIYNQIDLNEACKPICHIDDIFFPEYCSQIGVSYKRTTTLSENGAFCDYRFIRNP